MTDHTLLLDGLAFPESTRWHGGHAYVADWGRHQVLRVEAPGSSTVVATGSSFPMCFDFLPDGRIVVMNDRELLVGEVGGELGRYADLSGVAEFGFNDIAVDPRGNVFVNNVNAPFEEPAPVGFVVSVTPDGDLSKTAEGLRFPNGMAVTDDGKLLVAESHGSRISSYAIGDDGGLGPRETWAELDGAYPDGLSLAADGTLWYAEVPGRCCVRVAEGGGVQERVDVDAAAFCCEVTDDGLIVATNDWGDGPPMSGPPAGRLLHFAV